MFKVRYKWHDTEIIVYAVRTLGTDTEFLIYDSYKGWQWEYCDQFESAEED